MEELPYSYTDGDRAKGDGKKAPKDHRNHEIENAWMARMDSFEFRVNQILESGGPSIRRDERTDDEANEQHGTHHVQ